MGTRWSDWQESLAAAWLRKEPGGFWLRGLGEQKDRLEDALRSGSLARFPDHADLLALKRLGEERLLEWWPNQSEADYRARLKLAADVWGIAGTASGLLRELDLALAGEGADAGILSVGANGRCWWEEAYSYGTSQSYFDVAANDLDGSGCWNRFLLYLVTWDVGPNGALVDGGELSDRARRAVQRWRAAHAKLVKFQLVGADTHVWGGFDFAVIPPTAGSQLLWGGNTTNLGPLVWGDPFSTAPVEWAPPADQ